MLSSTHASIFIMLVLCIRGMFLVGYGFDGEGVVLVRVLGSFDSTASGSPQLQRAKDTV